MTIASRMPLPAGAQATRPQLVPHVDPLPDRMSVDPRSPHYQPHATLMAVGVRFKGVEKRNTAEYCVSEGWVRVIPAGRTYQNAVKLQGAVEPFWRHNA